MRSCWNCGDAVDHPSSLGVAEAYVSAEVREDNRHTHYVSLAPHEFVHIGRNHVCVNPLHSLELHLHPVPVGLDVLCVNGGRGVDEVQRVVDGATLGHWRQPLDVATSSPLITVDDSPWPEVSLHDRQESFSRSVLYGDHHT
jgi:hypothetical protein